jgi:hypothetical protein
MIDHEPIEVQISCVVGRTISHNFKVLVANHQGFVTRCPWPKDSPSTMASSSSPKIPSGGATSKLFVGSGYREDGSLLLLR